MRPRIQIKLKLYLKIHKHTHQSSEILVYVSFRLLPLPVLISEKNIKVLSTLQCCSIKKKSFRSSFRPVRFFCAPIPTVGHWTLALSYTSLLESISPLLDAGDKKLAPCAGHSLHELCLCQHEMPAVWATLLSGIWGNSYFQNKRSQTMHRCFFLFFFFSFFAPSVLAQTVAGGY